MKWLRRAFAVRPEGLAHCSPTEQELVEQFCQGVGKRGWGAAVLVALEMARPLHFLAAQGLYFFSPVLGVLVSRERVQQWAQFLERADAVEILSQRLETLEATSASPGETSVLPDTPSSPRQESQESAFPQELLSRENPQP